MSTDNSLQTASTSLTSSLEKMFEKIIQSPTAFFKNQQNDDEDLTDEEKYLICVNLFNDHPLQFLSRYYRLLNFDDVVHFRNIRQKIIDDEKTIDQKKKKEDLLYELNYYLGELEKRTSKLEKSNRIDDYSFKNSLIKNRRYAALKRLMADGEYFSDYEMRERDPLLYDQMIGRYQNEREQESAFHSGDRRSMAFSNILLDMYHAQELTKRRQEQLIQQNDATQSSKQDYESEEEEEMDDDEDDEADEEGDSPSQQGKRLISNEEKQDLRDDFMRQMQERFLDGKDSDFDYKTVDENPEYDSIDLQSRDKEDKYFDDEEEPEEGHNKNMDDSYDY